MAVTISAQLCRRWLSVHSSSSPFGIHRQQYALLIPLRWLGKILKGFSGAAVESQHTHALIHAYAFFYRLLELTGVLRSFCSGHWVMAEAETPAPAAA